MGTPLFGDFDMRAYWLDKLEADPAEALTIDAGSLTVLRKREPCERPCDIIESLDGNYALLSLALFGQFQKSGAGRSMDAEGLKAWIGGHADLVLDVDNLFFANPDTFVEREPEPEVLVRRLTEADAEAFAEFDAACSPEDLDAGYVELDHDIVTGCFCEGSLMSKASAYAFFGSSGAAGRVWDIGYVTRPEGRGRGFGRACAGLLTKELLGLGKIPLIRSQDTRPGSIGIARSLGFVAYGRWSYPETGD